ncbi:MAG: histidine kinase [Pseudomonadota bacterium]
MTVWDSLNKTGIDSTGHAALRAALLREIGSRISLRRSMARQVHDEIGQFATAIAFNADVLRSMAQARGEEELATVAEDLCVTAGLSCRSIRSLMDGLRFPKATLRDEMEAILAEYTIDEQAPQLELDVPTVTDAKTWPATDVLVDALSAFVECASVGSAIHAVSLQVDRPIPDGPVTVVLESRDRTLWTTAVPEPEWDTPWAEGTAITHTGSGFRADRVFLPAGETA